METFLKKYPYFHWINKYCIINNIKYILIKAFSIKLESEILKYFVLYDVIILKWNTCVISSDPPLIEWNVRCTIETLISPSFLKQEMHETLL